MDDSCAANVTADTRCCFVEWCESLGLVRAADGSPYFAPVTHFVSHAWHASFPKLVATLELYASGDGSSSSGGEHVPPHSFLRVFVCSCVRVFARLKEARAFK